MRMIQNKNPLQLLQAHHKVALITHVHPDGDAYGSLLGLLHLLKGKVQQIQAFAEEDQHSKFSFLPGFGEIRCVSGLVASDFDYCIALDCGSAQRACGIESFLKTVKQITIINVDHHISNTIFAHINAVDVESSSTSELVASLSNEMGWELSEDVATCLLTGIVMDTGHYLYENTTDKTHEIAAHLLRVGADQDLIRYNLYQNRPVQNVRLMVHLIDHMELLSNGRAVILSVHDEDMQQFDVAYEDLDEMIAYARDIAGVELAVIFKELSKTETKVSFRSKCWFDVNELASQLGGGGHQRAAGAVIENSLQEAKKTLIPMIEVLFAEVTHENGSV
ncbi:bifunctional oligoribonuclease/PAP phosphatase NrnA [Anoxynatronum sibiricum]|uniref:Bifunctional oligoribonuclease/PAP phosphatase NrnA n=1 Tax=Anoxynatronum sibiricum TaxID=210623 RepID=A0ABU9VQE5_9CLOT